MITAELFSHLQVKDENRNQIWEEKFFKLFSESRLKIIAADPQQGPDGWPYLMTQFASEASDNLETQDSAQKILHWLSTRGIGLVLDPMRVPYPEFVFSYGMIWSFRQSGLFMKYNPRDESKVLKIDSYTQFGPPSADYFPEYARKVVRQFLLDQGVLNPKVLMISSDSADQFDLCFSLESMGTPPVAEHNGILEALAWFLPPHYSVALMSEKNLPPFTVL